MKITQEWMNRIFWPKVKIINVTSCWEWQAQRLPHGYGQVHLGGKKYYPHRVIWEFLYGRPENLWVLHKCDNPSCVNPSHLFLGTPKDNTQDMMLKGRGPIGERQGRSKFNESFVKHIRKNYFEATNKKEFAESLGISPSHCCGIAYKKFWKHI